LPIFAVHRFGELFVYHNRCPHLGIELEWLADQFLDSEGELIQCATHGALFTIESGLCVAGPCTGEALDAIAIIEDSGAIYLVELPA
jgi:nitrite reductase/ring-hydroxylating ferredoxin subunit